MLRLLQVSKRGFLRGPQLRKPLPVNVLPRHRAIKGSFSCHFEETIVRRHQVFAFLGLLAFSVAGAWAQTAGSGEISGTVTDPAGAVVPGATVLVHNTDTAADRSLTTNAAGIYSATFLQTGHYEVSV